MMNYAEIISRQKEYFLTGETKNNDFRIEQLKKLQTLIHQHESDLYAAVYADFKKSEFDTYASELSQVYDALKDSLKHISRWAKRKRVKTNLFNLPGHSFIVPEPLGVCLIISD